MKGQKGKSYAEKSIQMPMKEGPYDVFEWLNSGQYDLKKKGWEVGQKEAVKVDRHKTTGPHKSSMYQLEV